MSKKLCITLFLVIALSAMTFGFEKGTKSIGGTVGFTNYKHDSDANAQDSIGIYPILSYFVAKNVCLDVSPGFSVSWNDVNDTFTSFSIGLGFRYFYKLFYAGALYDYRKSGSKGSKVSSQYFTLRAGRLMGIAKNVYLDFGLIYDMGIGEIRFPNWNLDNESRQLTVRVGVQLFF